MSEKVMTNPDVCPRCGTSGCPTKYRHQTIPQEWDLPCAILEDLACTLRLLARIQEAGLACTCPPSPDPHEVGCPRWRFER